MADPDPWAQFNLQPAPAAGSPADSLGRPVIVKGAAPTPPTESYAPMTPQQRTAYGIPTGTPVVINQAGKPEVVSIPSDKDKSNHWRPIVPSDGTLYNANRPGIIQDTGSNVGDTKYGPESTTQQGQAFKIGDSDEINHAFTIMDNLKAAREAAKQPLAAGTMASSVANIPIVGGALGQNRANLMTTLGPVAGDLKQLGIQRLYQMIAAQGGKGGASIARSQSEQNALQASMAALGYDPATLKPTGAQPDADTLNSGLDQAQGVYERHLARLFNMDPDNQTSLDVIRAAEENPANRQLLIQQLKQNGGNLGQVRFVTQADGQPIPKILVPQNASDEDVRNAVRNAGHNVAPNTLIIKGGGQPPGSPPGPPQSPTAGNGVKTSGSFATGLEGLGSALTLGLDSPIEAGLTTPFSGKSFDQNLADVHANKAADYAAHPIAGWAGTLAGVGAGLAGSLLRGGVKVAAEAPTGIEKLLGWLGGDGSIAKAAVRSPVVAAPVAAVEGAANAGEGRRVSGAIKAATVSSLLAPVATFGAGAGGKAVGWLGSKVFPAAGAVSAFSRIAPEADPAAMAQRAAELRQQGIDPAPIDTMNPATLDQVRNGVGGKAGSTAATILNEEADARAAAAPGRVTAVARKAIGRPPELSAQIPGQAASPMETRLVLGAERDHQFDQTIEPVRSKPVTLPGDVQELLSGPDMTGVVRGALKFTRSPDERQELIGFSKALGSGTETVNVGGKKLTTAQVQEQYPKQADSILSAAGVQPTPSLSLGAADALRRSIANAEGPNTPALTAARRDLTSFLENSVPEYGSAMKAYRTQSGIASPEAGGNGGVSSLGAKKGEALSLGENVLSANPEELRIQARNLKMDEPVGYPSGQITPREAAGEGAIRAIEQKASKSGGTQALGAQMQTPEQQLRNRTILPNVRAKILEGNLGAEADRVSAANRAAPASAPSSTDNAAIQAATAAFYHSPAMQGVKLASAMNKAKISADQANRIAQRIVTPAETDSFIQNLQRAGYNKQRATQVYQMVAMQLAAKAGRGVTQKSR